MKRRIVIALAALSILAAASAGAYFKLASSGEDMTKAAQQYLATLSKEQLAISQLEYDTDKRVDWHFIPKEYRKGLQIKEMNDEQRKAAHALLHASLSKIGYDKAVIVMDLEKILHTLEEKKGTRRFARDAERYYFTVFGKPDGKTRWGLSVEGHHLSLNFVVEKGEIISSTPTFYGANPATVKDVVEGGQKKGTRVLAKEEQLAFDLVNSLNNDQRKKAIIAEEAPKEIRAAGEPQPPADEKVGITYGELSDEQQATMRSLVRSYTENVPAEVAKARVDAIVDSDPESSVRFAWAGPTEPGIGHYYRIQGPTFLIEFVNTQPDAAGNPANHIHCVWRDVAGDFAIPIAKQ